LHSFLFIAFRRRFQYLLANFSRPSIKDGIIYVRLSDDDDILWQSAHLLSYSLIFNQLYNIDFLMFNIILSDPKINSNSYFFQLHHLHHLTYLKSFVNITQYHSSENCNIIYVSEGDRWKPIIFTYLPKFKCFNWTYLSIWVVFLYILY